MNDRQKRIVTVSKVLVIATGLALLLPIATLGAAMWSDQLILLTPLAFGCGVIGGFVSIQQRLQGISDVELCLLSESWTSVFIIPLFGGIFALVLYVLFMTEIFNIAIFPKFYLPPFIGLRDYDLVSYVRESYPESAPDMAKLMFWTFVAGFSERFVPQVIQSVSNQANSSTIKHAPVSSSGYVGRPVNVGSIKRRTRPVRGKSLLKKMKMPPAA